MDGSWLLQRLSQLSDQVALIWHERSYTYGELARRVREWGEILARHHVTAGQCVALCGGFSPGSTALLLALVENRSIAVPLTTPAASEREGCLEIACVSSLVAFDQDDCWTFSARQSAACPPLLEQFRGTGEAGLVLFSSGSTGRIKASLLSFPRLLANYQNRSTPPYRTLAFLMLDHIGGLSTLFHILSSGGTVVSLPQRTPEAICAGIERHRVQLLPTTPTFLRMLLISEAYKRYDLGSLELISYGTEPMPASTLESLAQVFPGVRLKQTYGLTEVGILPTKSENNQSLWLAVGGEGYQTKVVDGVLWIRTPSAMVGYLNAPSPFDGDGWFNTGDLVERRGDYLRFLGRQSEIINVGGEKVFPAEVENVIQQLDNVREVTVRGRPNAVTGNIVAATVELLEPEDPDALEQRVRAACRARLAPFKVPAVVEIAPATLCGERFKKVRRRES
jgi:acyl-CoA synthetase (AMP-forming)/AMP-acid ligase II